MTETKEIVETIPVLLSLSELERCFSPEVIRAIMKNIVIRHLKEVIRMQNKYIKDKMM